MDSSTMLAWTTLLVAAGGLVTSLAVAVETWRQRRNAVRPVLVVLEKLTDNKDPARGYSLYLVNMGAAVALNVTSTSNVKELVPDGEHVAHPRAQIAVGRRGLLVRGYTAPIFDRVQLRANYNDVNGTPYWTECARSSGGPSVRHTSG